MRLEVSAGVGLLLDPGERYSLETSVGAIVLLVESGPSSLTRVVSPRRSESRDNAGPASL